jgi:hypothetical protein
MSETQTQQADATACKCWAEKCRYNGNGQCAFKCIEIGAQGQCLSFAVRDRASIVAYLQGRGLSDGEIGQLLKEAGYGDTN